MTIPNDILQDLIAETNGATFFGIPVSELSRDELLAALGAVSRQEKQYRTMSEQRELVRGLFQQDRFGREVL